MTADARSVNFNLFDGLVNVTTDGGFAPAIAESYSVSDDAKTYTFVLRKDVQFHDGKKVTSEDVMYSIEKAKEAFARCGVEAETPPIRGGTDGAKLSFMGLPCPNLSTGGYNYHGRYEFVSVDAMSTMVDVLEQLVRLFAE